MNMNVDEVMQLDNWLSKKCFKGESETTQWNNVFIEEWGEGK